MTAEARKIREGDARALARAATAVENGAGEARTLLTELAPWAGRARVVGITGPPGAGKSTLVDAMAAALRARGKTVAVLAVDPSSRSTGGAILGDRIRMQRHHADPGIFIRSMATRGSTGGLARATADLVTLMDAAGRDWVIVETVGVGQDEVEIAGLAGTTVVVLVPGMGDDVQAIKAGIMEIADVFAINKSDRPDAERVEREVRAMLALADEGAPRPAIVRTVATDGAGIDELLNAIERAPQKPRGRAAGLPAAEALSVLLRSCSLESAALDRVALRVPDVEAAVARLRAAGARVVGAEHRLPGPAPVVVEPASAGGVLLELIEETQR
jgi:LAO/AO transport system kinase